MFDLAGNSWGTEENGRSCLGCGLQEEFRNCADISIGYDNVDAGTVVLQGGSNRTLVSRNKSGVKHISNGTNMKSVKAHRAMASNDTKTKEAVIKTKLKPNNRMNTTITKSKPKPRIQFMNEGNEDIMQDKTQVSERRKAQLLKRAQQKKRIAQKMKALQKAQSIKRQKALQKAQSIKRQRMLRKQNSKSKIKIPKKLVATSNDSPVLVQVKEAHAIFLKLQKLRKERELLKRKQQHFQRLKKKAIIENQSRNMMKTDVKFRQVIPRVRTSSPSQMVQSNSRSSQLHSFSGPKTFSNKSVRRSGFQDLLPSSKLRRGSVQMETIVIPRQRQMEDNIRHFTGSTSTTNDLYPAILSSGHNRIQDNHHALLLAHSPNEHNRFGDTRMRIIFPTSSPTLDDIFNPRSFYTDETFLESEFSPLRHRRIQFGQSFV